MKILIDYSWLRYRSKYSFKNLRCEKSGVVFNTGVIWGIYQSLSTIFNKNPGADIYLCLDGLPTKQMAEQATYKANRDHEVSVQTLDLDYFKIANAFSIIPNVKLAYNKDMEADETIAFLCEMVEREKGEMIVVFTTDMDLRQLVDSSRNIFCSKDENGENGFELEDENHVIKVGSREVQGLYPRAIALYKAICGDKSDNVIGVKKFPKALAKMLCNEYQTLEKLKTYLEESERKFSRHTTAYKTLLREWEIIESNYIITKIEPEGIPEITDQGISTKDGEEFFTYYDAVKVLAGIRMLTKAQRK